MVLLTQFLLFLHMTHFVRTGHQYRLLKLRMFYLQFTRLTGATFKLQIKFPLVKQNSSASITSKY